MQSLAGTFGTLTGRGSRAGTDPMAEAALGGDYRGAAVPLAVSQDWAGAVSGAGASAHKARRRLAARWWQRASCLFMCAAVVYGLSAGGHMHRIAADFAAGTSSAAVRAGFTVQDLTIEGLSHTGRDEIEQALGFSAGSSMLSIDTAAAQARLERLPWIRHAQVMRLLPSSVHVVVEEREPFAVWQLNGERQLVAADGTVLGPADAATRADLALIVGEGAAGNAPALFTALAAHPALGDRVVAAIRVADRHWSLKLASGVEVRLPEDGIEQALDKIVELDRSHGVLAGEVLSVDLRLPDRVSLRLSDAAAARWSEALKTTGERPRDKTGRDT